MNAIPKSKLINAMGGIACLFVVQGVVAETPEIVGQIISDGKVQVTSEGLAFTVEKGQPYLVFAGDVITTTGSAQDQTATRLIMDSVGTVSIAPDSEITVDRIGGRYEVGVKRGKLGYSLQDSADVRITTAQGDLAPSGQTGSLLEGVVANLGSDVMVYGREGSVPAVFNKVGSGESMKILGGDELIYSGPAKDSKIPLYAQLGATPAASQGDGCQDESGNTAPTDDEGNCPPGFFLSSTAGGIGGLGLGVGTATWLGVVTLSAIVAATDDDDDGPASPTQ